VIALKITVMCRNNSSRLTFIASLHAASPGTPEASPRILPAAQRPSTGICALKARATIPRAAVQTTGSRGANPHHA
jgi:hypothetical protein